jgi:hypothetical protein
LADKFNKGELSYDEYIEGIRELNLELYNNSNLQNELKQQEFGITATSYGGLSWITNYESSDRAGYWLRAGKMNGFFDSAFNSFMLDSSAVVSGSMISKHNRLSSDQGGLVSSFMIRADAIKTARTELLVDLAALSASLGYAVLTVPSVWGAIIAGGAAGGIAIRMWIVSSDAHDDIAKAYELVTNIKSIM